MRPNLRQPSVLKRKGHSMRNAMPGPRVRMLIADDHTLVAEAYKRLLESDYEVVGIVGDGHALLKAASTLRPQVIILDISMPLLNGLEAAVQLKHKMPEVRLVFLSMHDDPDLVAEAFRRGAVAYLPKTCGADELLSALSAVSKAQSYISPSLARLTIGSFLRKENNPTDGDLGLKLTERQREVVQLLAEGKAMKEIATLLNLTQRTVAFHKYRIMDALGLNNTSELVRYAIRHHMIEP